MRALSRIVLLLAAGLLSVALAGEGDAVDQALAAVGLSRAEARLDRNNLALFGGSRYKLSFFDVLADSPFCIPWYAEQTADGLAAAAPHLHKMLWIASSRLDAGVRRGQIVLNPLDLFAAQAKEKDGLANAIARIHSAAGRPLSGRQARALARRAAVVPASVAEQAALVLCAAADAYAWRERAFARARKQFDLERLFKLATEPVDRRERKEATPSPEEVTEPSTDAELADLIGAVDYGALFAGAIDLAMAADAASDALAKLPATAPFVFRHETPLGTIVLSSGDDTVYPAPNRYLLTIDLSGNDRYATGAANTSLGHPISVIIDAAGDDRYETGGNLAFGSAAFGYAFLYDLRGRDVYAARSHTQGSAVFGVGALIDREGDDCYSAVAHAQGAASCGIAVLADLDGRDVYHAYLQSQGFGSTRGFGLLLDQSGNDLYVANDSDIAFPSPQTPQHNANMSQGAGYGLRADYRDARSLAGGIGLLIDLAGDDEYFGGVFAQGVGYWYGIGLLVDRAGNDRYHGVWYAQGAAAHFAIGALLDDAGDDRYETLRHVAQGAGHDLSVGLLIDRQGNDAYGHASLSLGAGNANGIGIFCDLGGDDAYAPTGQPCLGAAALHDKPGLRGRMLTLGLFLDLGGRDAYPTSPAHDNAAWQRGPTSEQPALLGTGIDAEAPAARFFPAPGRP